MANSIKIEIELDGKDALNTIKGLEKGFADLGNKGTKNIKKMDSAIDSFIGNLGAMAATRAFDFVKDQALKAVDAFVRFESGITSVSKTTNFSAEEVKKFSKNIEDLAKEIPATTEELLGIAEAAGQLGVKGVKNVSIFTETIAKLGRVSNLEGDEAATTLARILNVTKENIGSVGTLADVIVDLGNNFAASEAEIAAVASEVARATAQFGVSSAQAAALGATLRSVGVRAEEAGGVLSKAFIQIDQALRKGGKGLTELQVLTGKTGGALKKAFKDDAIGVFRDFVAGLGRVGAAGGDVTKSLEALGIRGIRVNKVLPTLAQNTNLFDEALRRANVQVEEGGAVNKEFAQILDDTATKQALFANELEALGRSIFSVLAPAFNSALDITTAFLQLLTADSALDKAKARFKGLSATIKDVEQSTKSVNKFLPEFLANINTGFADDRIKRVNDELAITSATVAALSEDSTKLEKLSGEIVLAEKALADFNKEAGDQGIGELLFGKSEADTKAEQEALVNLKSKVISLKAAREEEIETIRLAGIEAEAAALKKANAKAKELEDLKSGENEKATFLAELNAANAELDQQKKDEDLLAKQLESEVNFKFLVDNLGREGTIKALARIKDIKDEKKRKAELKKLNEQANKESKAGFFAVKQFEDKTNTEKIAGAKNTLSAISSLSQSSNSALFAVGKASSLALAGINVAEGVSKALAAFPPPYNFAAATAVGAAGAVQIAKIASAKKPSAGNFATGGIVGGNSPTGDKLSANVNSGEMIFNKRAQKNLFNAVDTGNLGGGGGGITINNPVFMNEEMVDDVIDKINDRVEFNNRSLKSTELLAG